MISFIFFYDQLLIAQLRTLSLRFYQQQAFGIDFIAELFLYQLLLVVIQQVRPVNIEIAFHHGLHLVHVLTALTAASRGFKYYFLLDVYPAHTTFYEPSRLLVICFNAQ